MNIANYIVKIPTIEPSNFMTSDLKLGLILCAFILCVGFSIASFYVSQLEGTFGTTIGIVLMVIGILSAILLMYQRDNTVSKETEKNELQQEQAYEQQNKMDTKLAAELSERTGLLIKTEDAANMRSDDYDFITTSGNDKIVEVKSSISSNNILSVYVSSNGGYENAFEEKDK